MIWNNNKLEERISVLETKVRVQELELSLLKEQQAFLTKAYEELSGLMKAVSATPKRLRPHEVLAMAQMKENRRHENR